MKNNFIEYSLIFIGLLLFQILVLGNIHIAGVVNPFIYIYLIIILPVKINRITLTCIGFVIGFIIDAITDNWGVNAAATTLVAYLRPVIFSFSVAHENLEKTVASYASMKLSFLRYASAIVIIHHLVLFSLEAFSFDYTLLVLIKTIVSSAITIGLIYAIERLRK